MSDKKETQIEEINKIHDSVVEYYNSLQSKVEELYKVFDKEVSYTKNLEMQIRNKEYEMEFAKFKKAIAEDRAQISLQMENLNKTIECSLKDIDNREVLLSDLMEAKLHMIENKVEDFVENEKKKIINIEESLNTYRKEMTIAAENEYKLLAANCVESISNNQDAFENIKDSVVDFLKTCQTQNEKLMKKIPAVKSHIEWKDCVICLMSVVCLTGMVIQLIF